MVRGCARPNWCLCRSARCRAMRLSDHDGQGRGAAHGADQRARDAGFAAMDRIAGRAGIRVSSFPRPARTGI
jgi:hypothetical protein